MSPVGECVSATSTDGRGRVLLRSSPTFAFSPGFLLKNSVLSRDRNHVRLKIEMPSQEDMDLCTDKVLSKGRILQELTKAVKLVSRLLLRV